MKYLYISILLIFTGCIISCKQEPAPQPKPRPVPVTYETTLHTMEVAYDTILGRRGLFVYNDALEFEFDSIDMKYFMDNGFTFNCIEKKRPTTQSLWVKKDTTFIQSIVVCGKSDSTRTLVRQGVREGEEVVLGIEQVPVRINERKR